MAKVQFVFQRLERQGSQTHTQIVTDKDELTGAHGGSDPGRLHGGEGVLSKGPVQLEGVTNIMPLGTCFVIS